MTRSRCPKRWVTLRPEVSACIGAAIFPRDVRSGEELIDLADNLLYRAKNAGRRHTEFAA